MTEDNIISSPEETEEHTHPHEHTHSHEHSHEHHPNHTHTHSPEHTKNVINRMNRAIGHMESVRTMIEEGRDCSEVLIQIAAVRSAINNIGKLILKEHIDHCVVDAVETGDQQCLDDLEDAINKFIK
jgi:DNA-binding FrmR family transcriptional regulator